jgi:hypothetical protein
MRRFSGAQIWYPISCQLTVSLVSVMCEMLRGRYIPQTAGSHVSPSEAALPQWSPVLLPSLHVVVIVRGLRTTVPTFNITIIVLLLPEASTVFTFLCTHVVRKHTMILKIHRLKSYIHTTRSWVSFTRLSVNFTSLTDLSVAQSEKIETQNRVATENSTICPITQRFNENKYNSCFQGPGVSVMSYVNWLKYLAFQTAYYFHCFIKFTLRSKVNVWTEEGWSNRRMDEVAQWGASYFVLIPK